MIHTIILHGGAEVEGSAVRVLTAAQLEIDRLGGDLVEARRALVAIEQSSSVCLVNLREQHRETEQLRGKEMAAHSTTRERLEVARTALRRAVEEFRRQQSRCHCDPGPDLNNDTCGVTITCHGCRRRAELGKLIDDLQAATGERPGMVISCNLVGAEERETERPPSAATLRRITDGIAHFIPESAIAEGNPS